MYLRTITFRDLALHQRLIFDPNVTRLANEKDVIHFEYTLFPQSTFDQVMEVQLVLLPFAFDMTT
jgi:hypothetical protein